MLADDAMPVGRTFAVEEVLDVSEGKKDQRTGEFVFKERVDGTGRTIIYYVHDESQMQKESKKTAWFFHQDRGGKDNGQLEKRMVSEYMSVYGRLKAPATVYNVVSKEEKKADLQQVQVRLADLKKDSHPIAKALVNLLEKGYVWSGTSMLYFLGLGVEGFLAYMAEGGHDIDLYRDVRAKKKPRSPLTLNAAILGGAWKEPEVAEKKGAVKVHCFVLGEHKLDIDVVL